jgi:hypothetical protein
MLPDLTDIKIESNRDVDVVEIRVEKGDSIRVTGTLKNKSNHPVASADIACEVTDSGGTQLTALSIHADNLPPGGTRDFAIPITQQDAAFVLVRSITTH